ncbi:MAG: 30S ribosomal protein S20 [bacterium]|nr:30S ribosomal protein S20 [bacterium]
MAETAKKKVKTPEKMVLVQERRRKHNRSINTRVKNTFKEALASLESEADTAKAVSTAFSAIDRAVSKGVIHKNKAARRKSRLAKKINAAMAEEN